MYLKLIISLLLLNASHGSLSTSWEEFKRDYNKEYASSEEENQRREIFFENINQINEYQKIYSNVKFTIGINHLTDHRIEELISTSKSFVNSRTNVLEKSIQTKSVIPLRFDWRVRNVITSVRNQSIMGLAPAIAAVEVIESYRAIQTGNLTRGSVDQVHHCCGNALEIFDCILSNLGGRICTENSYSSSNGTCNTDACEPLLVIDNINKLETVQEETMLYWIQKSPMYIAIDASHLSFQAYQHGIYHDPSCSKTSVNHVLQLIGYGFQSGIPYWLCKNSWGETWGENGYVRIERGRNICGIASYVVQIENKPMNNAKGIWNFNYGFLAVFYVFLYILNNNK